MGSGIDVIFSGSSANVGVGYPGGDPIVDEASALSLGLHTRLHVGIIELRFSRLSGANVDVPNPGVVMTSPVLRGLRPTLGPTIDLRFSRPGNNVEAAGISAGQDTGRYRWKCFGVCDEGRDLQQGFWQGVTCFDGDTPPFGDSDAGLKSEFGLGLEEQQKLPLLNAGWPLDGVLGELVTDSERFGEAPGCEKIFEEFLLLRATILHLIRAEFASILRVCSRILDELLVSRTTGLHLITLAKFVRLTNNGRNGTNFSSLEFACPRNNETFVRVGNSIYSICSMIFSCAVQRRLQAGSQKSGGIPPRLLVFCTYNICTFGNDLVIAERLNLCLETWSNMGNIGNDDDHKQASGNKKASQVECHLSSALELLFSYNMRKLYHYSCNNLSSQLDCHLLHPTFYCNMRTLFAHKPSLIVMLWKLKFK
ncbi:unnamed protein product [Calypogeia fissa]